MKGVYWIHPGFRTKTAQLLPGSLRELGKLIVHVSFEKEEKGQTKGFPIVRKKKDS